jgi:cytidyltransferase-like protein
MKERIGYAYVVGDLLHKGHVLHLKNCKALCDKLIVGVLTDRATMEKKSKPIIDFDERVRIVESLEFVDATVAQDTYSPKNNIEAIKPDVLFESTSHSEKSLRLNQELMERLGGRMIIMPYYPIQSSTCIKEKIVKEKGEKK